MDFLNTQFITPQDGYLHVFRQPGENRYTVQIAPQRLPVREGEASYVVEVDANGSPEGDGKQFDVTLKWDPAARVYKPDVEKVALGVNDFVLWHVETDDAAAPPCTIGGEDANGNAFGNATLAVHDVFTHLFMGPGEYTYGVGESGKGTIIVQDHQEVEPNRLRRLEEEVPIVRIAGGQLDPANLQIVSGQTVCWLVEDKNPVIEGRGFQAIGPKQEDKVANRRRRSAQT